MNRANNVETSPLPYKRSMKVLGVTFLVYAMLVATHLGEFWPFSIFPMFSQAGHPWSRSIVREVSDIANADDPASISWQVVDAAHLPGKPVALTDLGVDPIDLANFVSKTKKWDDKRVTGLRNMFRADRMDTEYLLVFRAGGEMNDKDSVVLHFEPYVLLYNKGARVNPRLPR